MGAPNPNDIKNTIATEGYAKAYEKYGQDAVQKYQARDQEQQTFGALQGQMDQYSAALRDAQSRQGVYDTALQNQMKQGDALQQVLQKQYETYDPEAYAKATANAAAMANAAAARRAGATAGKAARLGNVGMGQTYASALGQGQELKNTMGQTAMGAMGQQQNLKAGQAGTYGQQALGWGGQNTSAAGTLMGGQQASRAQDERERGGESDRTWGAAKNVGGLVGGAVDAVAPFVMPKKGTGNAGTAGG